MTAYRLCVGCDQPFTPGPRGGFLCKECKEEIKREAREEYARHDAELEAKRKKE